MEPNLTHLGVDGDLAVFSSETKAAVIDVQSGLVVEFGDKDVVIASRDWDFSLEEASAEIYDLAKLVFSSYTEPESLTASARLYTIPAGVQAEAKKALEWRKEEKRGGTPVGLNTARTLAKGGQIGIEKIRHIAKYFPRHEVDKKGKGWKPGQDNFPSNGRIAWALWGGDAGWRWAKAIVEREDKKALKADGYVKPHYHSEITDFIDAETVNPNIAPEFIARVRMDGSGIDRIYKVDFTGQVYVWDDGCWDDLGSNIDGDVWTYDKAMDDPYDQVEKKHILIDPESAIFICARMQTKPFDAVSVFDIDADEAALAAYAVSEEDWEFIDYAVTAALQPTDSVSLKSTTKNDGVYTPEERAANVKKQARDASGQFVDVGGRVSVVGGQTGTISKVNEDGTADIAFDNGTTGRVEIRKTRPAKDPVTNANGVAFGKPLDVSGILGEPRTPQNMAKAQLPGTLPAFSKEDISRVLNEWPNWVEQQRREFKPLSDKDVRDYARKTGQGVAGKPAAKPKNHPMYDWLQSQNKKLQEYDGTGDWAKPVTAAAEAEEKTAKGTPSDVPPLYLAIVAPDDPRAVLNLISVVPESATSPQPMTYVRKDKKWVRDAKFLADLKSATPPPVVPLDADVLNDVLIQVDGGMTASAMLPFDEDQTLMVLFGPSKALINAAKQEYSESLLAAGGVDRNRGNAEKLRRYWTKGEGAAKIRWGTPGDWKRCVRYLGKYMGPRAKGYCQLRHKEATGVYTGSRLNPGNETSNQEFLMEEVWGENIGKPTVITEKEMLMPISEIYKEDDEIYERDWKPEPEIVTALTELKNCSNEEFEILCGIVAGARPPSGFNIDKNRGNAEKLRRYWTKGKGAAKIRWGTGGDWTRCVRHLSKYIGPRAKGYCSLRHKEVTGLWTGDQAHRKLYGYGKNRNVFSTDVINSEEKITQLQTHRAATNALKERMGLVASAGEAGKRFSIPLVIPEGVESGDGRKFRKGAIEMRELPLPLMWQIQTADGHSGSVVVGRIDHMERTEDGIGNAYGVFDTGAHAKEVQRLVENGFIRGVSADMDRFEATEDKEETEDDKELETSKKHIGKSKITIDKARIMGVTIVPKPAFQECKILIDSEPINQQEDTVIPQDGIYADDVDAMEAQALVACATVASAIPVTPPAEWFANPKLDKATPITVDDSGRVYGHIAAWNVDHIGLAFGTKPPRSKSNYAYFHTGVVRTESGTDVPVGQLTLAGGHASLEASAAEAVKHYDDTASAIADVHAGEDAYGIWVAGALRPSASPEQIRALRASAPSGDWRPIRGSLELVAVCQVNVPGFPIARARVASGAVMALVAAGAATLAKMKADPVAELNGRLAKLESLVVSERADEVASAKAKFAAIKAEKNAELSAKAAELAARVKGQDEFGYISRDERKKLAEKGEALPDGAYPIRNIEDLKNAIQAYGRSKESERAKVRKHIIKRASALKARHLVPEEWRGDFSEETVTASADDLRARIAGAQDRLGKALAAESPVQEEVVPEETPINGQPVEDTPATETVESGIKNADGKFTPQTQPRDESGKFRRVLARLKQNLGTSGLQSIVEEAKYMEDLHELGDYVASANAGVRLLDIIGRLDSGALNKVSVENVRASASELGKVIANLPLGFNNQADKVRYSDLPPSLQGLMDDMMTKVEAKIGKKDAEIANAELKAFKSGSDVYSQGEISAQMSKLLRLLT